jgi:hypothetical protein
MTTWTIVNMERDASNRLCKQPCIGLAPMLMVTTQASYLRLTGLVRVN